MISSRSLIFSLLSAGCIAAFLYYTVIPQGPHLFSGHLTWNDQKGQNAEKMTAQTAGPSSEDFRESLKLTPEVMLQAPRRSAAIPNSAGTLAVYTVTIYSFESHLKTTELRVLNLTSGQSHLISNTEGIGSPNWLDDQELLWLRVEKNVTKIMVGSSAKASASYEAGVVSAPVSGAKIKVVDDAKIAIALVAKARKDGILYQPQAEHPKLSSAKLYDNVMVRHWDEYVTPNRNAIWHGILLRSDSHKREQKTRYTMGDLTNILADTPLESPIPTFGGLDNFDIGLKGICFVAKDPELKTAFNTKSNFYYAAVDHAATPLKYTPPAISRVNQADDKGLLEGASTSPIFSPDGESAAWLQMKENGYESAKNRVVLVDIANVTDSIELMQNYGGEGLWDRSPSKVQFSQDGRSLYLTAEDQGTSRLFKLDLPDNPRNMNTLPDPLSEAGSILNVASMNATSEKLLVSGSSMIENSVYSIIDPKEDVPFGKAPVRRVISANTLNGFYFGLLRNQVSDIWFDGADGHRVHAWVITPSNFDNRTTYPLAYLVHGGPQGAWTNSWSTRWNPAIFAEQGYVVIAPNPTGSTGYGQDFTDGITKQWGGRPYVDLDRGFEYIKANLSYVDTDKAVALGASYGGYMMAWMQGHELGKKFKALVCHDGSFNLPGQLASDEQWFPNHDLGGSPTTGNGSAWDKWSPSKHISNWSTPMLVIHNELDYRLPISDGLAMFNVLQERGIKSRFLTFPDENHWVLKEENSLVWHTVVLNWINSFVGLPAYKDEAELGVVVQN